MQSKVGRKWNKRVRDCELECVSVSVRDALRNAKGLSSSIFTLSSIRSFKNLCSSY